MGSESLAFKEWVKSEGLQQSFPIDAGLKGREVAIEVEDYLNSLLTNSQTREPLLPALGGLPFALKDHIDKDLENFRQAGIIPIFVFSGLEIGCRDRKTISKESKKALDILDEAWSVYDLGRGDDAVVAFGKACTYRTSHIARYLMFYLAQQSVQVIVAPYSAAAQIAYLDEVGQTDCSFGSASILVFGVDQIITHFDWEAQRGYYVTQEAILHKLGYSKPQFVDLCLLSGSSILAIMPEVENDPTPSKLTAARAVLTRAGNNDGHTACLRANDTEYLDLFRKAKTAVQHMVIVSDKGEYKPLDPDNSPSDLHEVISHRLPDELMTWFHHGFIGSRVLNWRARSEIFETPPLDGGSSQAYKDLVQDKLRPMRTRCLAVLTKSLHRYYTKQDVNLVCWFNDNDKKALGLPDTPFSEVAKDAESWHVKDSLLNQASHVKNIDLNYSPIEYAITMLSDEATAKKTVTRRKDGEHSLITTQSELLSNILWRFLQDRGYINSDHTLSAWGKALMAAFERAISDKLLGTTSPPGEAEEAIFVAFELLRLDVLNSKPTFQQPPYTGAPMRGTDADKAHVNLISRVACLGTFKHHAIGYTGPLSRHLLAFHQVAAAVRNTLRDLTEVHACNMLLSASADRERENEYRTIASRMPFGKEPDLGLGLVVKSFLDEQSQDPSRRANIKNWFNHAEDIDGDLAKAWKMWAAINAGVQAADSAIVSSELKNTFQNADTWLQQKRQAAPITNGTNGA
ncbi:hypothetical protein PRZ48_002733 [Zasmidium cellare]|uniref:Uncharacterized protein n=1 Tax=Zasmidium cellare TaxID=395010 RepID=A0ABR0EUM0_ZASCE|nr:hypothetical protein PRZ48_002733 [Zasmidium cellare]